MENWWRILSKMKKHKIHSLLLAALLPLVPCKVIARDISFGISSHSGNFWGSIVQTPVLLINQILGLGNGGFSYDWLRVKDQQGKIKVDNGKYFGFKSRDVFNNFGYGITIGYQPKFSILGIFLNGEYNFRQFGMQPNRNLDYMERYKSSSWSAGAILRASIPLNDDDEHIIFLEMGTKYNKIFSCKGPFDNAKEQFGNGLSTSFGLGVRFKERWSIGAVYNMPQYDYFNRDFITSDGQKPYAGIRSKNHSTSLRVQIEL